MNFRNFVERIQRHSNPLTNDTGSWKPLGMVMPTGPFGALPSQWTGSQAEDQPLRSGGYMGTDWVNGQFDLALPSVSKSSQIRYINEKKNPIFVFLADGTKLYIPYDAFKKINVQPEVGRTMMVTFQRRNEDNSDEPSKIHNIKCF